MNQNHLPIVVTPGEPAGIGPDCLLKISSLDPDFSIVAIADYSLLEERACQLKLSVNLYHYAPEKAWNLAKPGIYVYHVPLNAKCNPGVLNTDNVPYVLKTIDLAVGGCANQQFHAMVTGPVHKGVINSAGIPFTGHTEWIADKFKIKDPVMLLVTPALKIALLTTHLPLSQVSAALTPERLRQTIQTIHHDLRHRFKIDAPRITVCGLNPHAGEQGYLGHEEIDVIIPVLEELRKQNYLLEGPVSADTAFIPTTAAAVDVFLTMYHDQGLPVIKSQFFSEAVNMTLGLPIIRTSVDHGTALNIAGTGLADSGSFLAALQLAKRLS